ncbi:hypothetical protein [Anaerococcus provencensis]|uniref:hypothetical protein n=1 Tax=Anaerococcus provencensis TaxID=938293 RepID=UPI0002FBBA35|nr:hypothetical protein [Anaerococcus provencensis]
MDKDKYFESILKKLIKEIAIFLLIVLSCMLAIDINVFKLNNELHKFFIVRLDMIFFIVSLFGIIVIITKEFLNLEKEYINLCKMIDNFDESIVNLPIYYKTLESSINKLKLKQKDTAYEIKKRVNNIFSSRLENSFNIYHWVSINA